MFRARGTSISLRDLRIAKLQKRIRFTPCGPELDAFLAAVAAHGGDEDDIPTGVKMALSRCMEASVSNVIPRQQHCVCIIFSSLTFCFCRPSSFTCILCHARGNN
jgi:hypothetical protein